MFKTMQKTIFLLSVIIIGGNIIGLLQKATNSIPEYYFILTLSGFLIVAWRYVLKLLKVI